MAYTPQFDFRRPSSTLSIDTKHASVFGDDLLDHSLIDSSVVSPAMGERRHSFANSAFMSPEAEQWEEFNAQMFERPAVNVSNNPFFAQAQQNSNNPFRSSTQVNFNNNSNHQQQPQQQQPHVWNGFEGGSGSCTPTTATFENPFHGQFDSAAQQATYVDAPSSAAQPQFHGLPFENNGQTVFAAPAPMSAQKDWMAMAEHDVESKPIMHLHKRMRPNTPPRTISELRRGDGIRKKNARFEIPPERKLDTIDDMIARCGNDEEKKELKAQKRLLRNRQAALDSRQRKKKHTEQLEEEKKYLTELRGGLEDELNKLSSDLESCRLEKEQVMHENVRLQQLVGQLQWDKENLVQQHTLETGELRGKISVLTERLEAAELSGPPSATGYSDFTSEMDNLTMGGATDWDNYLWTNDLPMDADTPQANPAPTYEKSLVISPKKKQEATLTGSDSDKPVASGLLLMLLLCGAFVASKSAGSTAPAIPRMPDDVRAASATVLDSIFKDAGVAPQAPFAANTNLIVNRVNSDVQSSSNSWQSSGTLSRAQLDSLSQSSTINPSTLSNLHSTFLSGPTKDQEAEQLFSLSVSQYNSLTSHDFLTPPSDSSTPQPSGHRRNLAETLAAMRGEAKGETAAEVYTRSLLWERIPSEVVREFKRMVEESDELARQQQQGEGRKRKIST